MNIYNYTSVCALRSIFWYNAEKKGMLANLEGKLQELAKAEEAHFYATQITREVLVQWSGYFRLPKLIKQAEEGSA